MDFKCYRFYGSSDDCFNERVTGEGMDDCGKGSPMSFIIKDENGCGVVVTGQYCPQNLTEGTWLIGVALLDEEKPLFDGWEFNLLPHNDYSNLLIVKTPNNTSLEYAIKPEED